MRSAGDAVASWRRRGALAAVAYLLAVVAAEWLRRAVGWPQPDDIASSPSGVAAGQIWSLVTSGMLVAGDPVPQIAGTAVAVLAALEIVGAAAFWIAVAVAHVGSALLAYAGIAVLRGLAVVDVDALVDAPDYGISAVWAGAVGALAAAALTTGRRRDRTVALLCGAVFFAAIPPSLGLAGVEHALSFVLGAATVVLVRQRAGSATTVPAKT